MNTQVVAGTSIRSGGTPYIYEGQQMTPFCYPQQTRFDEPIALQHGANALDNHLLQTVGRPKAIDVVADLTLDKILQIIHECEQSGEQRYWCKYCTFHTLRKDSIKIHLMRHGGIKNYRCKICYASFVCNSDLNNHCLTKHQIDHGARRK